MCIYNCDIWCSRAGSLIPVRLWVFTYVSQVVMATRDGDAGTVCAERTRKIYMGYRLFIIKLQIGIEISITQRENQLEY